MPNCGWRHNVRPHSVTCKTALCERPNQRWAPRSRSDTCPADIPPGRTRRRIRAARQRSSKLPMLNRAEVNLSRALDGRKHTFNIEMAIRVALSTSLCFRWLFYCGHLIHPHEKLEPHGGKQHYRLYAFSPESSSWFQLEILKPTKTFVKIWSLRCAFVLPESLDCWLA